MEFMRINSNRKFSFNGKKYFVQNLYNADKKNEKEKYCLTVDVDGFWKVCYEKYGWEIPHFNTIKDAQRYVRDWDFLIDTM